VGRVYLVERTSISGVRIRVGRTVFGSVVIVLWLRVGINWSEPVFSSSITSDTAQRFELVGTTATSDRVGSHMEQRLELRRK
jgi:hypothetical protein